MSSSKREDPSPEQRPPLDPPRSLKGGDEGAGPPPPTPVRTLLEAAGGEDAASDHESPEPPRAAETTLVVDGQEWTVRVAGRGRGGAPMSPVPFLLLRFFSSPEAEDAHGEALVVARALSELSPSQLEEAFLASRPLPEEGERKPLFPEIVTKGNRGDG